MRVGVVFACTPADADWQAHAADAMGVVPAPGPTMSMDAWATIEASVRCPAARSPPVVRRRSPFVPRALGRFVLRQAIVRGMTECPICITALTCVVLLRVACTSTCCARRDRLSVHSPCVVGVPMWWWHRDLSW